MKKIINGLRYDTEKAIEVGAYSFGNYGDFSAWDATLYRTPKSGRFFLAGGGGPMSRYAKSRGSNTTIGGEGIDPLTRDEALAWAEQYLSAAEIEEHFGSEIEDA